MMEHLDKVILSSNFEMMMVAIQFQMSFSFLSCITTRNCSSARIQKPLSVKIRDRHVLNFLDRSKSIFCTKI